MINYRENSSGNNTKTKGTIRPKLKSIRESSNWFKQFENFEERKIGTKNQPYIDDLVRVVIEKLIQQVIFIVIVLLDDKL